ncbi:MULTISPECIES: Crp/Fnr family transcriptional regulator [unclassified Sphingomonas]|uniref:Crp/Fnr family transcriptional regulator n=1 Tax=unclassified Sphingomonas TaxID=196159 RepID=UPI0006F24576|nr:MULTISPECIES: Crp/Fnr family transcriptional regulator [unclassified Sphingomonas]KQM98261.1 Crp/Fnr family transcriptional regulator [Sphingomonas sp. Leaf25]KQN37545.1 Crp/Fnr family transcriptional regulator [Sphingomonas sp. Leaf42]KQT27913.1 Crp/Fnr family transcriptional regulator [Sphingomonas sp. Leaf407]
MIDRHLAKLRARDTISAEEEAVIRQSFGEVRVVPAGTTCIRAGERLTFSTLLLDGFMCRYKDLPGGERQITEVHTAGDFLDLHSFSLKQLDHNIMALTASRVVLMPHTALTAITEHHPHLARVYWFLTALDAAIHREWVLSLGRRTAIERIAHLVCELRVRLGLVDQADDSGFDLPLTQTDLSDCTGLTPVHVNRTLRDLRERGLMEFRSKRVTIHDMAGLIALAEFDDNYLYLRREAR